VSDLEAQDLIASNLGGAPATFWYVMAALCFIACPLNYVLWRRSLLNGTSIRQQQRYRRAWQLLPLLGLVFLARVLIP